MKLTGIHIKNFKAIYEMKIDSIENALILVGQNNTGKTTILEAIRAAFGDYHISAEDFDGDCANIEMDLSLEFSIEDLKWLHQNGIVSQYKRYETWLEDFCKKAAIIFRERRRVRRCTAVYLYRTPGWLGALSGWGAQNNPVSHSVSEDLLSGCGA